MYLYFNKEGVLTTSIYHGEPVRQNSYLHLTICLEHNFYTDVKEASNWSVNILIIKPDKSIGVEQIFKDSIPKLEVFFRTNSSEVTYDLVDGKEYWMYHFTFPNYEATDIPGRAIVSTSITKVRNEEIQDVQFFGNADIYVEPTIDKDDREINITPSQYEQLINQINTINISKVTKEYLEQILNNVLNTNNFTTLIGTFDEDEILALFDNLAPGGYILESELNGPEIMIIGKDPNIFSRYAGGITYSYNFEEKVWKTSQKLGIEVDTVLSQSSANPISNMAVATAIDKVNKRLQNIPDALSYSSLSDFLDRVFIEVKNGRTYISKIITEYNETIEFEDIMVGTRVFLRGNSPDYWLAEKIKDTVLLGDENNIKLSFFEVSGGDDITNISEEEINNILK